MAVAVAGSMALALAARACGLRAGGASWLVMLALDALENLFAMHGNVLRSVDADANLIALDPEYRG